MTTVHLMNKGKLNAKVIDLVCCMIGKEGDILQLIQSWYFVEKTQWPNITPAVEFIITGKCLEIFEEGLHTLTIKQD